ncbi:MAG TPA: hypothetical protein VJP84_01955 [Steroidobacteraceae bacterium]|nr:hypothetical protein [Steroidobacteraceae bacterium]
MITTVSPFVSPQNYVLVLFWGQAVVGSAALQEFEAFRICRIGGTPFDVVYPTASYCALVPHGI